MTIPSIIAKHIEACVAELTAHVKQEFHAALGGGIVAPETSRAKPVAAKRSPSRTKPTTRATVAVTPTRGPKAKDRASAKPAPSKRTCGCGPVGRHRRECKLATGTGPRAAKKPKSDDEDSGAGRDADAPRDPRPDRAPPPAGPEVNLVVAERQVRRARNLDAAEELPVIPHAVLVAMLVADRANNAVGDLGGVVLGANAGPSLVGHANTKREHCPVHGWVGRVAFEREGHHHCRAERPVEAIDCPDCEKTPGWSTVGVCARCDGHTFIVEIEPFLVDNRERISAEVQIHGTAPDGSRIRGTRDDRGHERAETTSEKRLTKEIIRAGWLEIEALDRASPGFVQPARPRTRAECGTERPCPWVGCREHLYLDVTETGSIKLVFPDLEPWELKHSCALDAAELGPHTLDALGEKMNITRERARQIEVKALHAGAAAAARRRIRRDVLEDAPQDAAEGAGGT